MCQGVRSDHRVLERPGQDAERLVCRVSEPERNQETRQRAVAPGGDTNAINALTFSMASAAASADDVM
jgi:hypothetical protein